MMFAVQGKLNHTFMAAGFSSHLMKEVLFACRWEVKVSSSKTSINTPERKAEQPGKAKGLLCNKMLRDAPSRKQPNLPVASLPHSFPRSKRFD